MKTVRRSAFGAGVLLTAALTSAPFAQTTPHPPQSHLTIPFLASVDKPNALEFEGGECDVAADGTHMTCAFQQLFLTTSEITPDTCLVTTNRYERAFRRDAPDRWISTEGPAGVCGILDIAALKDGGGVRWTLELRKEVTKKDAAPSCQNVDATPEAYSWQNIRRPLPCRFVQPGGLLP